MKGKLTIKIETTDDTALFPSTERWEYTVDNTFDSLENWLDLFEKILVTQGFFNYKLDIKEED